jgi:hypothetical protein
VALGSSVSSAIIGGDEVAAHPPAAGRPAAVPILSPTRIKPVMTPDCAEKEAAAAKAEAEQYQWEQDHADEIERAITPTPPTGSDR